MAPAKAKGAVIAVRYADDTIVGFEHRKDMLLFLDELKLQLKKFGLELNGDKTRAIMFGRFAAERRAERGLRRPETFDFLGFTHYCGKSWKDGHFMVRRKTTGKRMRASLKAIRANLRRRLHDPVPKTGQWLKSWKAIITTTLSRTT